MEDQTTLTQHSPPPTCHPSLCLNCTHYQREQREGRISGRCRLTRNTVPRTLTGCFFWESNSSADE